MFYLLFCREKIFSVRAKMCRKENSVSRKVVFYTISASMLKLEVLGGGNFKRIVDDDCKTNQKSIGGNLISNLGGMVNLKIESLLQNL